MIFGAELLHLLTRDLVGSQNAVSRIQHEQGTWTIFVTLHINCWRHHHSVSRSRKRLLLAHFGVRADTPSLTCNSAKHSMAGVESPAISLLPPMWRTIDRAQATPDLKKWPIFSKSEQQFRVASHSGFGRYVGAGGRHTCGGKWLMRNALSTSAVNPRLYVFIRNTLETGNGEVL